MIHWRYLVGCADLCEPDFALDGLPFGGGAIGYLAYDLKNVIEDLPRTAKDDCNLPDIFMFWPGVICIHDRWARTLTRLTLDPVGYTPMTSRPIGLSAWGDAPSQPSPAPTGLRSTFSRADYVDAVQKIRTYIRNGDVYQVNLSQRFEAPFNGDPFGLWRTLFDMNPAPFFAFIQAGDHQILSTSMERFLLSKPAWSRLDPSRGPANGAKLRTRTEDSFRNCLRAPKMTRSSP